MACGGASLDTGSPETVFLPGGGSRIWLPNAPLLLASCVAPGWSVPNSEPVSSSLSDTGGPNGGDALYSAVSSDGKAVTVVIITVSVDLSSSTWVDSHSQVESNLVKIPEENALHTPSVFTGQWCPPCKAPPRQGPCCPQDCWRGRGRRHRALVHACHGQLGPLSRWGPEPREWQHRAHGHQGPVRSLSVLSPRTSGQTPLNKGGGPVTEA